ncbi:MAG: SGNH/GDSL hydrolase family protein [Firmicutes bacterium]|nr:SGNH/GDSL hydrolase family protein [Bacillota bacterium]
MKYFNCTEAPIKVYGLAYNGEGGRFWKMHESVVDKVSAEICNLGRRNTGGRIRFATNSKKYSVRVKLQTLHNDYNFSIVGGAGCDVYTGSRDNIHFVGRIFPMDYSKDCMDNTAEFKKSDKIETITINLPRNESVCECEIGIEDDAELFAPEPYTYEKPTVFYGSSITEGCTAERPGCSYVSMLSRWLDTNYINLGFSGAGKGEPIMADYIAGLDPNVLVCDYDHNAPDVAHLERTHEPFYKRIREKLPELPILFMTKPDAVIGDVVDMERRNIIYTTYQNAVKAGDKNVYFLDGSTFYGAWHREDCTMDNCHPNSIGFWLIAQSVYPLLKSILEKTVK